MFGRFYLRRDTALSDAGRPGQLTYARELLADLLNRAATLDALGLAWFQMDLDAAHHADEPGAYMEADEALRRFAVAAREFFEHDCGEARIRGRRARLFADDGDDRVNDGFLETEESLTEIGGALVPGEGAEDGALHLVEG